MIFFRFKYAPDFDLKIFFFIGGNDSFIDRHLCLIVVFSAVQCDFVLFLSAFFCSCSGMASMALFNCTV